MRMSRDRWPFVQLAFMDSGFAVHARRWVVGRFFAWIGRNRRLAKDFEATIASANAFLYPMRRAPRSARGTAGGEGCSVIPSWPASTRASG